MLVGTVSTRWRATAVNSLGEPPPGRARYPLVGSVWPDKTGSTTIRSELHWPLSIPTVAAAGAPLTNKTVLNHVNYNTHRECLPSYFLEKYGLLIFNIFLSFSLCTTSILRWHHFYTCCINADGTPIFPRRKHVSHTESTVANTKKYTPTSRTACYSCMVALDIRPDPWTSRDAALARRSTTSLDAYNICQHTARCVLALADRATLVCSIALVQRHSYFIILFAIR